MIIRDFRPFVGEHCETTAIGNLLKHDGLELTEPLLFGLGGGLGFIYWKMKTMPVPFLGGRTKDLTRNLCDNLGLTLVERETTSLKMAWDHVVGPIQSGKPVGLQLDCYHLDYFSQKIHFAGHHVAMYGFDETDAYLVDTRQQGGAVKTTLQRLALARSEKGPMSARNRSYRIEGVADANDLCTAIPQAIRRNAEDYLNPPIQNLGYKGILKTSIEIGKWLKSSKDPRADFAHTAAMMERAGTGGALFRNLYGNFLGEAYRLLQSDPLQEASESFAEIAEQWTFVASLFERVATPDDTDLVREASNILVSMAKAEKGAMTKLYEAYSGK
ncbi:MAG TPA: BtrH N-terminal domain-containing protein [Kiritimatiellia bacterium]|nr:BtrH N-terminal domain-containing protein [Kiritimatiellia bacterium]